MNLNSVMRLSYLLAWVFAAIAVIYRALEMFHVVPNNVLQVSSRGVMFLSGILFLATIATAAYAQAAGSAGAKSRGIAA